ncbi:PTS transporter subunit EIIC [Miniphocaeibacter halophilus]|uniref:PTS transporter subunit EIIC n=1 Tax=Miniphocaeibacter halophilus TaxID=2931922 RepID=A0AC61MPF1_9FIRM|nr:PTS transporter subunit EIIC [Miniphocaeibacter halophilus]QQK07277.1 PTS transporter subunit EIIC [Miniphocaeibacter halophilus]
MKKHKIMDFLSALGRSLMMPIAALAASGVILGITGALLKTQVLETIPLLKQPVIFYILNTLKTISGIVFTLIPVLFAISISFGLAKEDKEIAAFAGFIGYYTFLVSASCVLQSNVINFDSLNISTILGVETIDMGAVAGIITGVTVAALHNKYHKIEFPVGIAFYGGKRFVSIVVILAMTLIGQIAPFIWQPISYGITFLGKAISNSGAFGVFTFGFLERLLIPTGLHHVLNGIFRTTAVGGVYEGIEGCLNIFLQFFDKVDISEMTQFTRFLGQGKMPFMMFGLPAAAFAIYRTTPKEKSEKVKALMIAGVAASIISGITEPLEFAFMFIAPAIFVFHAVMGGISFMLMSILGVTVGNTGGGIIDFIIWGVLQPGSKWYWIIIVGVLYAIIYYFVFRWYFTKKNLSIDVADNENELQEVSMDSKVDFSLGAEVIKGLGGKENITSINNCISRLRVDIINMDKLDEDILKRTGSMGIVRPSDTHIHVIYGPKVEKIANAVKEVLKNG